jgi:hypothetical protein
MTMHATAITCGSRVEGESGRLAVHEIGHDDLVEGEHERDDVRGDKRREEKRQGDQAEGLEPAGAEVARRLVEPDVEALEAGHEDEDRVWDRQHDVAHDERRDPERHAHLVEEDEQADGEGDVRHDQWA